MIPLRPDSAVARRATAIAATALVLLLSACADMGNIGSQATLRDAASLGLVQSEPAAAASPAQASQAARNDVRNDVDSQWWRAFGDAQLDALVEQAVQGNPNLQIAQARLVRAQASTAIAEAADKPQLNGSIDLNRTKFSENYIYPSPLGGSIREIGTAQVNGSWEIDFFGKNRTAIAAAIGAANAAAADADAARVLLAANVARAYMQWARLDGQLALAQRSLAQREEILRLVRDRVTAGLDTRLELSQSETGLPEARQQIELFREQIAISQNAIDALVAQPGTAGRLKPPELGAIQTAALPSVVPADLLGRRADIAAARWRVEAATQDVANAKTQFYPNVNLVAFAGYQAIGFSSLAKSGSQEWGIGPAIRLPIFEGGKLRANLRGKAADLDAAIDSYNSTVLDAVREASDQVVSVRSIARQQVEQRAAEAAAETAYDIAVQRYGAGLGNYLNVLTAETTVLLQRRQGVDLAARALDAQVGLARALGGGWQPPTGATSTAAIDAPKHP